ncbi:hypothetical protein IV203_037914 [Nitzschia inconspicua]|uniref:Uncharacterized protein n=1 Tax=Nitzschia inconspicua TaxID=303405 RepID=A0A9K3LME3_9STRA|nr:hypothetical protein IV203_037914 [Nitzschia inconspicua]
MNDSNDDTLREKDKNSDENEHDHGDDDDNDVSFYRDLQQAKAKNFGASIPKEQLQATAAQAESDFLKAMKETQEEFEQTKAELGADAAVDMLLDRIRQEDYQRRKTKDHDDDVSSQSVGAFE